MTAIRPASSVFALAVLTIASASPLRAFQSPAAAFASEMRDAHAMALGALERVPALHHNLAAIVVRFAQDDPPAYRASVRALVGDGAHQVLDEGLGLELVATRLRPRVALERLAGFVEYAELDVVQRTTGLPNDPNFANQWGCHNTGQTVNADFGLAGADINAPQAWDVGVGDPNFAVAVIDTGVLHTHPDLAANIWSNAGEVAGNGIDDDANGYIDDVRGWDFAGIDANPVDEHGHGTHVAGTIGAVGGNGLGNAGVAWRCKLVPLRFIGAAGGLTSDAVLAIGYCRSKGIKVSNNSWGSTTFAQSLSDAIAQAGVAGHLFIAAAGNNSQDSGVVPFYPAAYPHDSIISVAATTNDDTRASFSNWNLSSVDLGAPGMNIHSTYLSNVYTWMNGTSMASPHVAGTAVLVWSANPAWNHAQVRSRILSTTRPVAAMQGVVATGGVLDAAAAMGHVPGPNTAPTVSITTPSGDISVGVGIIVTFTGVASDAEQGNLSSSIAWSSNLVGNLGTGATISTSALGTGVHTITARVADLGGLVATATRLVTVGSSPPPATPNAPTTLRVRRQSAGLAALTWRDNSTNETGFEIERQRRSGSTWVETTTLTTAANAVSTTNNAGIGTFRYRIRARNGTAASAWTAYVSITL